MFWNRLLKTSSSIWSDTKFFDIQFLILPTYSTTNYVFSIFVAAAFAVFCMQLVKLLQLLSLSAHCNLKIPKICQCQRQPGYPRKTSVPLVNDPPTIVDIFQKLYENSPCIKTILFGRLWLKLMNHDISNVG